MKLFVPLTSLLVVSVSLREAVCFSLASRFRFGKKSLPTLEKTLEAPPKEANGQVANGSTFDYGDKDLNDIFKQNLAWKKAKEDGDPDYFEKMGSVHKPKYLWIGTSSSMLLSTTSQRREIAFLTNCASPCL